MDIRVDIAEVIDKNFSWFTWQLCSSYGEGSLMEMRFGPRSLGELGVASSLLRLYYLCKASCNAREACLRQIQKEARQLPKELSLKDQNKPVSQGPWDYVALKVSARNIEIQVSEDLTLGGKAWLSLSLFSLIRVDILCDTNKCALKALRLSPALSGPLVDKACIFWATDLFLQK